MQKKFGFGTQTYLDQPFSNPFPLFFTHFRPILYTHENQKYVAVNWILLGGSWGSQAGERLLARKRLLAGGNTLGRGQPAHPWSLFPICLCLARRCSWRVPRACFHSGMEQWRTAKWSTATTPKRSSHWCGAKWTELLGLQHKLWSTMHGSVLPQTNGSRVSKRPPHLEEWTGVL